MRKGSGTLDRREFLWASAALLTSCSSGSGAKADLILTGGEIHTATADGGRAEAMAISSDRILAVGSAAEVDALRGSETRVVQLAGRTVIPGINDSHLHALNWGLSRPPFTLDVGHPTVSSIAEIVDAVGARARELPAGTWILGRGWDEPYFAEGRAGTRQDLDGVSPDHPVMLTEFSGHAIWVNSAALRAAGITRDTVPPPGGVIVKDAQGEPTGVLFEGAAWQVRDQVPEVSADISKQGILAAATSMLELGITSFTDPWLPASVARLYEDLARDGSLAPRAQLLLNAGNSADGLEALCATQLAADIDPLQVRIAGIKIMGDGIPTANKTAWLHEEYEGGGNGHLLLVGESDDQKVAELHEMIRIIHASGLQIGTHATGDRAIDAAVDGYAAALAAAPRDDARHYVIHADLASPATLTRMAQLGVGANFNPGIKFIIADGQVASLGASRSAYEWPYRTALDEGVVVASSSDAPVTNGDWRQGLSTCLLRQGQQSGQVSGPEQRITLDEALRTYTWAGAWQDHAEADKGTLEPGKLADLCVLEGSLDATAPEDLPQLGISATVVGGREVSGDLG